MITKVDARSLITANRIDLITKYKYVEMRDRGYDLAFIKENYLEFISSFTDEKFIEEDGTNRKHCAEDFLKYFDELIISMRKWGYRSDYAPIPITLQGDIDNGAHRTAIAAYYNMEVPVTYVDNSIRYDYKYFQKKLISSNALDYSALEYARLKKNIYLACIWPRADLQNNKKVFWELMSRSSTIVYTKEVNLSFEGLVRFVSQIYSKQTWVGSINNHFQGAIDKAQNCYKKGCPLTAILFEAESLEYVLDLKSKIRKLFGIGNHSIHVTDNQIETLQIADILYNQNSINLLNHGNPEKYKKLYNDILNFKKKIEKANMNISDFILDSSSIMGLYGLREVNDLDFLSIVSNSSTIEDKFIENHFEYAYLYGKSVEELIFNPQNHLIYYGIKFITLDVLKEFKRNRAEKKDLIDYQIIDEFQKKTNTIRMKFLKLRALLQRKKRRLILFFAYFIKKILVQLGIFDRIKYILKSSNRKNKV